MLREAPELEKLCALTHEWRHVATQEVTPENRYEWRWHGDLWIPEIHRIYRAMRDDLGTLVQATYRPRDGRPMIFAAIAKRAAPMASYDAAVDHIGGAAVRAASDQAIRAAAANRKRRMMVA